MRCRKEDAIDLAAIRLADMGLRGDIDAISRALPEGIEPDLHQFLRHTIGCARCGQLLELLLDTEFRSRQEDVSAGTPPATDRASNILVFPLRPLWGRENRDADSWEECEDEIYDMAAESPRKDGEMADLIPESRVLSLTTEDGACHVRIMPNATGTGAVAILIDSGAQETAGDQESPSARPPVRAYLRVHGTEYPFHDGMLTLHEFPAADIELVFR